MRTMKSYKFLALVLFALLLTYAAPLAQAQTYKVLHTFGGSPDGQGPLGTLVLDAAGNLYGATTKGGSGYCADGEPSCGTVFMLSHSGEEVGVFSFSGHGGTFPEAGLFRDAAGNLYGTTGVGGAGTYSCGGPGCGTAFELDKKGTELRYYSFTGQPDGYDPMAPLIEVTGRGGLYGTTYGGGTGNLGTVYRINSRGEETVLYSFEGGVLGGNPLGITADSNGNLYGITLYGGSSSKYSDLGFGTAYALDKAGKFKLLYDFGGAVGANPESGLVFDSEGNLYGVAEFGGNSSGCLGGCGTVFELSPQSKGIWSGRALYTFSGGADGAYPMGALVFDALGNLYGTTPAGGAYGQGTVFKLDPSGNETVLYSFTGGADGGEPFGGVIFDAAGNLYGTTSYGGYTFSCDPPFGCGVVFELTP